ncbi:SDR family oxidoreductase [Gracilinema caldarium]|uniref:SDR family oxidoreductase n=1 Tax=Gracilinema caldarium TaxID=215591 RepID=UPI0026EA1443|nr:SDR family oxidoreductase [Gracilinema caldarium]
MNLELHGKTVLVAASSEGLGFATAQAALQERSRVWIGSRDANKVTEALSRLRNNQSSEQKQNREVQVDGYPLDVTRADSIAAWVAEARSRYGEAIDALVVNSGGPPPGLFADFDDQAWQGAFELLLLSAVRLVRACLPGLAVRGGAVLIVSSTSVTEPIEGLILSNALRSATVAMAKTLSRELAPRGIRINCLAPGRFATGRVERIDAAAAERMHCSPEEARRKAEAAIPLGRYGTTEEFGRTACFLISPAASYMTGQLVTIDGGMTRGTW